jgi:hypothetical protein
LFEEDGVEDMAAVVLLLLAKVWFVLHKQWREKKLKCHASVVNLNND